jgi:hypothetical protein
MKAPKKAHYRTIQNPTEYRRNIGAIGTPSTHMYMTISFCLFTSFTYVNTNVLFP